MDSSRDPVRGIDHIRGAYATRFGPGAAGTPAPSRSGEGEQEVWRDRGQASAGTTRQPPAPATRSVPTWTPPPLGTRPANHVWGRAKANGASPRTPGISRRTA